MSFDLANISKTTNKMRRQTSNANVVSANIIKLQTLATTIEQERKLLQDEKTKLRRLKKKMEEEKTELALEKTTIHNQQEMIRHQLMKQKSVQALANESSLQQRKAERDLQKRLDQISKELTATKRKLMSEQRKGNGDTQKKLKQMERRYHAEKSNNKSLKKELDSKHAEVAILKRKLIVASRKGGSNGVSNNKYRALLRKWIKSKKKLKLAQMELQDRANFYRRKLADFKKKQSKWLRQQKELLKNKKEAVKYVFVDDMVQVKFNTKHKDRVKVVTKKGKTVLIEKIKVVHEKNPKNDDETWLKQDEIVQNLLELLEKEENEYKPSFYPIEQENEYLLDDESDGEDMEMMRGDVIEWKREMEKRNEDMEILMSIASQVFDNNGPTKVNFNDLISGVVERNKMRFEEMDEKQFTDDYVAMENEVVDAKDSGDEYDESMQLLKTNCDEYLMKLQHAISNVQTMVETNNLNNKPRVSMIKRKSMQVSQSQSLLSISDVPLLTPSTSSNGSSNHSNNLPGLPLLSSEQISLFNPKELVDEIPKEIADEMSTFYIGELEARCNDINQLHGIFYGSENGTEKSTYTSLEDIIKGIDFRIDDIEDGDELMVNFIGNMQKWKIQFQEYAIRYGIMIKELNDRRNEMKQLFDVIDISNETNKAILNRINTLGTKIDNRHQNISNIIDNAKYEAILGEQKDNEQDENENSHKNDEFIEILENVSGFEKENENWRTFIDVLKSEANNISDKKWSSSKSGRETISMSKIIENCMKRSMTEVESRTHDVEQLKDILYVNDTNGKGRELLNTMELRHTKLNEVNNDIIKSNTQYAKYCVSEQNNSLWWKAVQNIIINKDANNDENVSVAVNGLSVSVNNDMENVQGIDYNENLKYVLTNDNKDAIMEDVDDDVDDDDETEWWLMLDEKRNKLIESIDVTISDNNMLSKLAVFVSRILKFEKDKFTKLYIPIDINGYPSSQFRILATFFDGVIITKLLCLINEDLIDFRGIHKPQLDKLYPLKQNEINENISVILSSLKSMGIVLDKMYSIKDWYDPTTHCELLINLLTEIASRTMDRFCSYKTHPELLLLKKKTEPISLLSSITGEKWIIRWINYMLKRNGRNNNDIDNENIIKFNKDFMKILGILKRRNSMINGGNKINGNKIIKVAKTLFNIDTPIEAKDLKTNNRFCQNYFAAQIFDKMNGLKLTNEMKEEQKSQSNEFDKNFTEKEKESIIAWLNSFGLRNKIEHLEDIGSGITLLKVLDRLKKGSVPWKKVKLQVRHKFDHVMNCNEVVDICTKQLGLKFVNVSGMDIVDKNTLIIKSILWRIMRYQSIKILSDLQFGSNISSVNNEEIIKWCNQKLKITFGENDLRCKQIKKLKDLSLTTGIYYLELIRAIIPNAIDESLIHFDVKPLSSSVKNNFETGDKYYQKRKENLKYLMTIIRRYSVDLFINVDDLFRLESRAVVSVLAALMTISLSSQQIKKGENKENETDSNIEEKKVMSPLHMENVEDIDIDSILDSVDSLYKK